MSNTAKVKDGIFTTQCTNLIFLQFYICFSRSNNPNSLHSNYEEEVEKLQIKDLHWGKGQQD